MSNKKIITISNEQSNNGSNTMEVLTKSDLNELVVGILQQIKSNLPSDSSFQNLNETMKSLNETMQQLVQAEEKKKKDNNSTKDDITYVKKTRIKYVEPPPIKFVDLVEQHYKKNYIHSRIEGERKYKTEYKNHIKGFVILFGETLMSELNLENVYDFIEELKNKNPEIKPTTIKRRLKTLKAIINHAIKLEFIEKNILDKFNFHAPDVVNDRALNDEECELLLWYCQKSQNKELYLLVQIALNTGARKGEILCIKKDNIVVHNDTVYLKIRAENSKSAKERLVPINKTLLDLLNKHLANIEEDCKIFKYESSDRAFRKVVELMIEQHGIEDFCFHSLRHTCGTKLHRNGTSLVVIKELLGHSTIRMTERYAHSDKNDLKLAVQKLESNKNTLDNPIINTDDNQAK